MDPWGTQSPSSAPPRRAAAERAGESSAAFEGKATGRPQLDQGSHRTAAFPPSSSSGVQKGASLNLFWDGFDVTFRDAFRDCPAVAVLSSTLYSLQAGGHIETLSRLRPHPPPSSWLPGPTPFSRAPSSSLQLLLSLTLSSETCFFSPGSPWLPPPDLRDPTLIRKGIPRRPTTRRFPFPSCQPSISAVSNPWMQPTDHIRSRLNPLIQDLWIRRTEYTIPFYIRV